MPEPITWLALEMIAAMLQDITVANGYHTDLGAGVITLNPHQRPEDEQPFTVIGATDVPVDEASSGSRFTKCSMEIVIEFTVPFDESGNAELLAHRARADIVRRLRGDMRGKPEGVTRLNVTGSRLGSPEDGAAAVIAQVSARASLTDSTPPANP